MFSNPRLRFALSFAVSHRIRRLYPILFLLTILVAPSAQATVAGADQPPGTKFQIWEIYAQSGETLISYSWNEIEEKAKTWLQTKANAIYPVTTGCDVAEIEGPPTCTDHAPNDLQCAIPIKGTYNALCGSPTTVVHSFYNGRWYYTATLKAIPEGGPCCDGKCKTCVGNPIDPSNGNKYEYDIDYAGGPGIPSFGRVFNSQGVTPRNSSLGTNWSHNYARSIVVHPAGDMIIATRARGTQHIFKLTDTGNVVPRGGLTDSLTKQTDGWTYSLHSGVVEKYNLTGQLLSETDANGKVTTLGYNASNQLSTITGPYGHTLTLGYDTQGRLATLTDPNGKITRYGYNTNNDLSLVTYPDGTGKQYHYEDPNFIHNLTGVSNVDTAGVATRFSTFGYDAQGLANITQHAQTENGAPQEKFTLTYSSTDISTSLQTQSTDSAATVQYYNYNYPWVTNGVKLPLQVTLADNSGPHFTYDANNNLTCRYDHSGSVYYTYNTTNQRISKSDNYGAGCGIPPATARVTTYQYLSPTLDLPTVIESPSVAGGTNKKRTTIGYTDARFPTLPTSITQSGFTLAGVAVSRSVALTYTATGQVATINGPRLPSDPGMNGVDDLTTLTYYDCTTGGACGQLKSVTNALGQTTTYDVYYADGRLQQKTDPTGLITLYSYDARGRVFYDVQYSANNAFRYTRYTYTPFNQVSTVFVYPDNMTYTYGYDAAHDLRSITDSLGNKVTYAYDVKGNRTQTLTVNPDSTQAQSLNLAYDARNYVNTLNHGGNITKQVHNSVGNLVNETQPNDVAAANGRYGVLGYDYVNRLLTQSDPWSSGYAQYAYDVNDHVTRVTGPGPYMAVTTYSYDDLGNRLQEVSPDRGTTTYTYDAAGNVRTQTDARNVTATYTYDALNRLTLTDYPGTTNDVTYTYDTAAGCTNGLGRLCAATVGTLTTNYAYNDFGYLSDQTDTVSGNTATLHTNRDLWGRVLGYTYPGGRAVTYTRDARGRIATVSASVNGTTTPLITARAYRGDDQVSSQTFGNSLTDIRTYTDAGRLQNQFIGNADTRVYGYDYNGNLTSKQSLPEVASYTYNYLDFLTGDNGATPLTIGFFGSSGNRTSITGTTYTYTPYTNRLATIAGQAVTLSANGNLMTDPSRGLTYSYSPANDLANASQAGNLIALYSYDGQHRRTSKFSAEGYILYHYDEAGHLLQETDSAGTLIRAYVWADDMPIAQITKTTTGEVLTYLHTDYLNTPRLATDTTGKVVWRWEGKAFGDTQPNEDPTNSGVKTTLNLRYAGQYYDGETGLYYNWHRYYDPRLGRYITSDPIGLAGGLNTYAYVTNNPLKFTDPSGLDTICGQDENAVGTNPDGSVKCAPKPGQPPQCLTGECANVLPKVTNSQCLNTCMLEETPFAVQAACTAVKDPFGDVIAKAICEEVGKGMYCSNKCEKEVPDSCPVKK